MTAQSGSPQPRHSGDLTHTHALSHNTRTLALVLAVLTRVFCPHSLSRCCPPSDHHDTTAGLFISVEQVMFGLFTYDKSLPSFV